MNVLDWYCQVFQHNLCAKNSAEHNFRVQINAKHDLQIEITAKRDFRKANIVLSSILATKLVVIMFF